MALEPRTKEQISLMRHSGKISAKALKVVIEAAKPGVSLIELDKKAEEEIIRLDGKPSFKEEPGYSWTTCLTVNDEVVHGIPREIILKKGDILGIDVGAVYKGWHTDTAWSVIVGRKQNEFLKVGERALWAGIDKCIDGNKIGDIAGTIQEIVEEAGYKIVRTLIGHGIGEKLHEEPDVPGFGEKGTGILLKSGMSLAIEVIYTAGSGEVEVDKDGWTIRSVDHSMGGLFEMTVIVGKESPEVLTDWRVA